jgi:DNA-binding NarL/FixJ family response regulator
MMGQIYLSPSITSVVVKDYLYHVPVSDTSAAEILSDREREIVQLIAEGKSMKEIAYSLGLSIKTISTHRQNILRKLHVDSVAALVKFAIREGLVTLEE